MKLAGLAVCLVIGLGLAGGVGADAGGAGTRETAQPVAEEPPRSAANDERTSGPAANAGADPAPGTAPADAAAPAKPSEKSAEAQPGAPRDSLWLLLLQVLRSPR